MEKKKTVLIYCKSNLKKDPRILRQIIALKDNYNILAVGYTPSEVSGARDLPIIKEVRVGDLSLFDKIKTAINVGVFKRYEDFYWDQSTAKLYNDLLKEDFDFIIANEANSLPICTKLAKEKSVPVYCDLHEYYPVLYSDKWMGDFIMKPYVEYLLKKYLPKAQVVTTVAQGISDLYKDNFGIDSELVFNARDYIELSSKKTPEKIRIVHHGNAMRGREIDRMVQVATLLPPQRFEMHFYLVPTDKNYIEELKELAEGHENIFFHGPVTYNEIVNTLSQYDLGIHLLTPTNLNNLNALPNKFFEFIQGRLAIAVSPSKEMERLVNKHNLGVVGDDFSPESLANKIMKLTPDMIDNYKKNSNEVAKIYNAEGSYEKIRAIVSKYIR